MLLKTTVWNCHLCRFGIFWRRVDDGNSVIAMISRVHKVVFQVFATCVDSHLRAKRRSVKLRTPRVAPCCQQVDSGAPVGLKDVFSWSTCVAWMTAGSPDTPGEVAYRGFSNVIGCLPASIAKLSSCSRMLENMLLAFVVKVKRFWRCFVPLFPKQQAFNFIKSTFYCERATLKTTEHTDVPSAWPCQWMTLQCVTVPDPRCHRSETSPRFQCRPTSPGCWGWTGTRDLCWMGKPQFCLEDLFIHREKKTVFLPGQFGHGRDERPGTLVVEEHANRQRPCDEDDDGCQKDGHGWKSGGQMSNITCLWKESVSKAQVINISPSNSILLTSCLLLGFF